MQGNDSDDRDVTPASLPAVVRASLPAPVDPSDEEDEDASGENADDEDNSVGVQDANAA